MVGITKTVRCPECQRVYNNFEQMPGFDRMRCGNCEHVFDI